ncbi:MAG TPA: hypothetical protein VGA61_21980, partial [Anaerolineae bacterium]
CRDRTSRPQRLGLIFWLQVLWDELPYILGEQISRLTEENRMLNRYTIGLGVGLLGALAAFLTNVVFPQPNVSDDARWLPIVMAYVALLVIAAVSGFVDSRRNRKLLTGVLAGATTAVIIMAIVVGAFTLIDIFFFDIVRQQVDKIAAFNQATQATYHDMKQFVVYSSLRGLLSVLPAAALAGALCGGLGAFVRKLVPAR